MVMTPTTPQDALRMQDPVIADDPSGLAVFERDPQEFQPLAELLDVAVVAGGDDVPTALGFVRRTCRTLAIRLDGPIPGVAINPWLDDDDDDRPDRIAVVILDRDLG